MPYDKMELFSNKNKSYLRKNNKDIITTVIHKGNWKEKILSILNLPGNIDFSIDISNTMDLSKIVDIRELDELKEKHKQLSLEDIEKIGQRKTQIQKMLNIDSELQLESNDELSYTDFITQVNEALQTDKSFIELYECWKQTHKDTRVKRNPVVAAITKKRAQDKEGNYCCELCDAKSFESSDFDSHHMIPIGNGGIDNIYNTVCLCPNCHRYVHSGKMTLYHKNYLFKKIRNHLFEDNPEYLSKFDEMISPIAETEEYYQEHKDEIDYNFSVLWNDEFPKSR